MNGVDLFKGVLRNLKLEQPVGADVREHMLKMKRPVLSGVLREAKNYSVYFGLLLLIFFKAKKMGFSMSLAQCVLVLWVSVIVAVAGLSAGVYAVAYTMRAEDMQAIQETLRNYGGSSEKDVKRTEPEGDTAVPEKKGDILVTPGKPAGQRGLTRQGNVAGADDKKKEPDESRMEKKQRDDELREQRVKNIPNL